MKNCFKIRGMAGLADNFLMKLSQDTELGLFNMFVPFWAVVNDFSDNLYGLLGGRELQEFCASALFNEILVFY